VTEAKLYDRSFSEGYEAGFAGRARECPYIASELKLDEEQWHAGYLYGQHVAVMQHLRPHHNHSSGQSFGILTICTNIIIPVAKIVGMA
jgi:ribosome modulation factor